MAQAAPQILEVKPGVRVRAPDTALKEKLGGKPLDQLINEPVMKQAQVVIDSRKASYPTEARGELMILKRLLKDFSLPVEKSKPDFHQFCNLVLNMKSMAGMFGYPFATEVTRSLLNYCDKNPLTTGRSERVLQLHISTLDRIFHDVIQNEGGPIGEEIVAGLRKISGL